MAFVNGGLGSGFGGLDKDVDSPRSTPMVKTTSFMNKRNKRGSSNTKSFQRTPGKDQTSIELLRKHLSGGKYDLDLNEGLSRQNTMT